MKINNIEFWKDKKVFITGGAGFIGEHLVEQLHLLGSRVVCLFHKKILPDTPSIISDLSERDSVHKIKQFFSVENPDIVFHLAAQPLVNREEELLFETLDVNIRGTYNLLAACVGQKSIQSIVHVSTDKVYGNLDIITERDLPNGVEHPYNTSKLSGDLLAQMFSNTFGLPITIIRNGNIFGRRDLHWERIIPRTIKRVLNNESPIIRGNGSMMRDFIYVPDIIKGLLNSAEFGWGKYYPNILRLGSKRPYTVQEVVDLILKITGKIHLPIEYEPVLRGEIPNQHIQDLTSQQLIDWYPDHELELGLELAIPYYTNLLVKND